jgi:hypothetical protein
MYARTGELPYLKIRTARKRRNTYKNEEPISMDGNWPKKRSLGVSVSMPSAAALAVSKGVLRKKPI